MLVTLLALLMISINGDSQPAADGTIVGVVVNGTQGGQTIANIEVQLRAGANGVLEPVDATKTDLYGRFVFRHVSLDPAIVYLPGANRDGVHYPGQRVRLDPSNRIAHVTIVAFDAVSTVSPLTAVRHEIDIEVEKHLMSVRETLLVSNPSRTTYVGQSQGEQAPVTLCLSIPADFDRVTFDNEFYGRRFRIVDHRVLTDIPWTPSDSELGFTYRVPLEGGAGLFRRPLDLPCSNVHIRVRTNDDQKVVCNLPRSTAGGDETVFASTDKQLPSGYTIELQIGNLPIPWMLYARWSSLGMLCVLILGTLVAHRLRGRRIVDQHSAAHSIGNKRGRRLTPSKRAA